MPNPTALDKAIEYLGTGPKSPKEWELSAHLQNALRALDRRLRALEAKKKPGKGKGAGK